MNIFLVLIMSLFMAGYYMFFAPNTRVHEQETDYAISQSDLHSVADCMIAVHNAKIMGGEFIDVCVEQNMIKTDFVCLDSRLSQIDCSKYKKPTHSFIVTTSGTLNASDYNEMMEILEKNFATSGTFGIYQDGMIFSGGTSTKRDVPKAIQKSFDLQDGQLVYMTQYDIPDENVDFVSPQGEEIVCPLGTTKTYRFGRWQCTGYNIKTGCGGDTIWDSNLMTCVPDETRKPLCVGKQTAVMVDDLWQCIEPFGERNCPDGLVAKLNYETLEWECTDDPEMVTKSAKKKCELGELRVVKGSSGAVARVYTNNPCTDCEKVIVNESDCSFKCIPDPEKIKSKSCYPGDPSDCSGTQKAFYFGFPDLMYIGSIPEIKGMQVPFDTVHSRNRMFNCLYCRNDKISKEKSKTPYIAVCEKYMAYAKGSDQGIISTGNNDSKDFEKTDEQEANSSGDDDKVWTSQKKANENTNFAVPLDTKNE